ncbi:hypothetical protein NLU13_7776 [Sarocladium strictum]|uniref:Uncharacterized protein n=1 Tax=Sarocladium strictum TaxID=5046 RepID=A0AA39GDE6_SARSR|nr:hypothetical protein NLU13_7776 [Sarocladium strictum]
MASTFERNEELCQKYARFASHLDRWHFKTIYWSMFVTNLLVLFVASWTYTRGLDVLEKYKTETRARSKKLRLYIALCFGCVCASTVIVVMEAFCLMALQFCDGEDLISLYWSTWTMIQVGSLIAMVGIILALVHSLTDRTHPPWALALGTPVLVIAGALHFTHACIKRRVKTMKHSSEKKEGGPPMSQVNTIQVDPEDDEEVKGEIVGFTIEGGPIVRFAQPFTQPLPDHADLLGSCEDNRPLVAYRKDSLRFLSLKDDFEPKSGGPA